MIRIQFILSNCRVVPASVLNQEHPKRVFDFKYRDQYQTSPPADIIEGNDKNLSKQINYCNAMGIDQIVIYDRHLPTSKLNLYAWEKYINIAFNTNLLWGSKHDNRHLFECKMYIITFTNRYNFECVVL